MSDIEIARKANKKHIKEIASKLNIQDNDLRAYGPHIAKIDFKSIKNIPKKKSKLI
jgi:formate--tetrahydrofolate ligase